MSTLVKVMEWKACCLDTLCAPVVLYCYATEGVKWAAAIKRCTPSCHASSPHGWPVVLMRPAQWLINKYSPLTRQHTSSCNRDLWTVKLGLKCPTLHPQSKTSLWPPLLALCHTKHMPKCLADFQSRELRISSLLSALFIQNPLGVIVFNIFSRRLQDHYTALSEVVVQLPII